MVRESNPDTLRSQNQFDEVITDDANSSQSGNRPALEQLELELGHELSKDAYNTIQESYKDTGIILRGNEKDGYIATLGMYKVLEKPTLEQLHAILDKPDCWLMIKIMNCMLETFHVVTSNDYRQMFTLNPLYGKQNTNTDNPNTEKENTAG